MSLTWGSAREVTTKSGTEKKKAAGQGKALHISYVGDTT
jgi:oxalate decarboxylase/phosphoglucose isomerase-like protein (cupin superfamily)